MVDKIRTVYPCGLNKGFKSRFYIGSRVRHETQEEGRKKYQSKRCVYKDEDNNPNVLNDKDYQTSSQICSRNAYRTMGSRITE